MKKPICGIYTITNTINNKVYVGQSVNIKKRWQRHKANAKTAKYKYPLYNAINKYGIENFSFDVVEECEKNELDIKEIYYITQFDSFNNGYNLTPGGQAEGTRGENNGSAKITNREAKQIAFLLLAGFPCSEVCKKFNNKITISTISGISCGERWLQTTEETKQSYSYIIDRIRSRREESGLCPHRRSKNNNWKRGAERCLPITDQEIAEIKERYKQGFTITQIASAMNRARSTVSKYANRTEQEQEEISRHVNKPIKVKNIETNLVFESLNEAAQWCGLANADNIRRALNGEQKTAGKVPTTGEHARWEKYE